MQGAGSQFRWNNLAFTKSRTRLCAAAALLSAIFITGATAQTTPRLTIDSQCATIDGKDLVLFSGAFHYFRCPKQLWPDRFRKLKEAGFNTLETYTAWNYHEPFPPAGVDDFSKLDMTELQGWLTMATDQFGFYVILRPGPYICAEWDGGGYPQWLLAKRPADFARTEWYRSDDPAYLAWCKHWYSAVAKVAVPFQITHRPAGKTGILFWQIENEYNYSDQPAAVKHAQLTFLAHTSRDLGIDIPLTTCMTDDPSFKADPYLKANVIETRNTYPKYDMQAMWKDIGMLYSYQPDKFKMISELQGGWFAQVGGKLSDQQGFGAAHINHITINAWESGFTSTNYYMGFGGTNFGDWPSLGLTTTYDYDAPIRECGGVTARYFAVKALGQFIAQHGPALARSKEEVFDLSNSIGTQPHLLVRRAADGSRFIFLRNLSRDQSIQGSFQLKTQDGLQLKIDYSLEGFGAKILYLPATAKSESDGTWFPQKQEPPQRPTDLPADIKLTDILQKTDIGPSQWMSFDPSFDESHSGIFNRNYVFYRATIPATANDKAATLAFQPHVTETDFVAATVGGAPLTQSDGKFEVKPSNSPQTLIAFYENAGRPNFGKQLEQPSGLLNPTVASYTAKPMPILHWQEKHVTNSTYNLTQTPSVPNDPDWSPADISVEDGDLKPNTSAVYRAEFSLDETQVEKFNQLTFGRIDDQGKIYLNGESIGDSHDWEKPHSFNTGKKLHAGTNSITVLVNNRSGKGGLSKGVTLEPTQNPLTVKWEFSQQSEGVIGQWWNDSLDESTWKKSMSAEPNTQLSWYRLKFELPVVPANQWVPWKINLNAVGNGFVYLNGHPLGRWWEVGPQHDFYLPECWLQFGPGKQNLITIEMRSTEKGNRIDSASVGPYRDMAEIR